MRAELERLANRIRAAIDEEREKAGRARLTSARGNLVEPFGAVSFRVTHSVNMQHDADDRLLLDERGRGAPQAFRNKTLIFAKLGPLAPPKPLDYMTKYEKALVRPTLRSAICAPVFHDVSEWTKTQEDRAAPLGVFCFDSDEDLDTDFQSSNIKTLIATESAILSAALESE